MGFIRTLLIIIVFYYIFKFVARVILPIFITNRVNKMANDLQNQQSKAYNQSKRNEGKVTIKSAPKNNKVADDDLGEYVKFEEVD